MSTALILHDGRAVTIAQEAEELKASALEKSALIAAVRNADDNTLANEALRELRSVSKAVEDARKKVKQPVLDLCRLIDAAAKDFTAELTEEESRIAKLASDWHTEQLEIQRAAERKRIEEEQRIQREREAEERRIREEAERAAREARLKAEAEALAARNEAERIAAAERAKAEQERIAKLEAERQRIAAERAQQELLSVATKAPPRAEGQVVKPTWSWEVTDIWLLARTNPGLVRIEPNKQQINEVIAALAESGTPKLAGLRIWEEVKVSVRIGHQKAIDV